MGKIVNDSLLGDVIGQVGNLVISHNGNRKYVKQKGKKKNNHTKPRQKTESLFGELPKLWKNLTIKEKRTWFKLLQSEVIFKSKGNKEIVDPRTLFISLNRNLQESNEQVIRTAPQCKDTQMLYQPHVDIILKEKDFIINFHTNIELEENTKVIIYATPSLTVATDTVNERLYRKIAVLDSSFVSGSSITKEYLKVFKKTGRVGEEFSFKFKTINRTNGIIGTDIFHIATVISPENQ